MPDISLSVGALDGGAGSATLELNLDYTFVTSNRALQAILANVRSPVYDQVVDIALAHTTLALPTLPRTPAGVVILPPQEATYGLILTDSAWATAIPLHKTAPSMFCFDQAALPTNLYLNWAGLMYKNTAVTPDPATDIVAHAAHTFVANDRVRIDETTVTVPTGLYTGVWYYVRDVVAVTSYKLALTAGGTAVDFTTAGATVKVASADRFHFFWF